jgi:outer membrane protein insertion porin family
MKRRLIASLALALTASPLIASELYDEKKVQCIEVLVQSNDPNYSYDERSILTRLKTKEGDNFNQLVFDNDLKTLSGEYEKVQPEFRVDGDQITIVIRLSPKPLIHEIRFVGNESFSTAKLQSELEIEPYIVFNRLEFNKALNKIKELYIKKGYFESQVSYTLEPVENTNTVDVVIHVREGRSGNIGEIDFEGFSKEERSEIVEMMYLKKYNLFTSWLTGSGVYREEALEQDRMTILNFLHNEGYADARVDITVDELPGSGKLNIAIRANRGELYHVGELTIQGNTLFPSDDLLKRSIVQSGSSFSPEKVRESAQAIQDYYGAKGYIDASVQYESKLHEDQPLYDVAFEVDEGKQYKVGLIHVIGNRSTKTNVILRESLLVPGETFDTRKLRATQSRLEQVGYFKAVNVYAVQTPDDESLGENYRDVYIEVEETSTGNVSLFMGFSSMDSVNGGLDLTERNFNIAGIGQAIRGKISSLRGGGQYFHLRGTIGARENNVLLSWMNPYVNDSLWRFGFELSETFSRLQDKDVRQFTYGGSVFASYPISNFWTYGMRQRVRHTQTKAPKDDQEKDEAELFASENISPQESALADRGLISAFSVNLGYDSTDNAMKPHQGWRSYSEAEIAGLGGKFDFWKFSYLNSIYFPITKKGTFKLRADFRYIVPYGKTSTFDKIPYTERLFLGGESSVRGYKPFILGPHAYEPMEGGQVKRTNTPLGGVSQSLASLEYNIELHRQLDFFLFLDSGSVSDQTFTVDHIRASTGAGVRVDMGNRVPIVIGWGYPLTKKHRSQDKQPFFFSMGGQF